MTTYAPLLTKPADDQGTCVFIDPAEALKLVARLRGVSFFLSVEMFVWTVDEQGEKTDRGFDLNENLKVSAAQVETILRKKADFNDRKVEAGKTRGLVEVRRLGDCLFFG